MKLLFTAGIATCLLAAQASAQDEKTIPDWYVAAGAGVYDQQSEDVSLLRFSVSLGYETGYAISVSGGRQITD